MAAVFSFCFMVLALLFVVMFRGGKWTRLAGRLGDRATRGGDDGGLARDADEAARQRKDVAAGGIGVFDGTLTSLGDREWGLRVAAVGLKGVYAEAAQVDHPARRTLGDLRRRTQRMAGGFYVLATRKGLSARLLIRDTTMGLIPLGFWLQPPPTKDGRGVISLRESDAQVGLRHPMRAGQRP